MFFVVSLLYQSNKQMEKYLIGGQALVKLGSSRQTIDTDYLINDLSTTETFIHDKEKNIDYCNANGLPFFKEVYEMEISNGAVSEIASPQALLELKAFSFVQHLLNGYFQKADDAEYDIKFLVRNFNLKGLKIANKYLNAGQVSEINKIINSVKS